MNTTNRGTNKGTTGALEVLRALQEAGPAGMTSVELQEIGLRAQARIVELRQDGYVFATITSGEQGSMARYVYRGKADPDGHEGGFKTRVKGSRASVMHIRPARHQESPWSEEVALEIAEKIKDLVESYLPNAEIESILESIDHDFEPEPDEEKDVWDMFAEWGDE